MPAEYDWTIRQGETEVLSVTYEANLAGYQARCQARETFESTGTLFSLTSSPAAGIVLTTGATASTAVMTLSSTTTAALSAPNSAVWDLEFFDSSTPPVVICPVRGSVVVIPEVTR